MLQAPIKRPRDRFKQSSATPVRIASATKSVAVLTVVFNQPVSLNGVPQYATNLGGVTPVSAVLTSPTTVAITFSATIAAATSITIPFQEPSIRNTVGGFVADTTFPV